MFSLASDKYLHVLLRFFVANGTYEALVVVVALLARHQMAALIDVANDIGPAQLALEFSCYACPELHLLLEVVELPLAHSFPSGLVAQPDVLDRPVDKDVAEGQHGEGDDYFFERNVVDFVVPKGGDGVDGFSLAVQGPENELWFEDKLLLGERVLDDSVESEALARVDLVSDGLVEMIFLFVLLEDDVGSLLCQQDVSVDVAVLDVDSDLFVLVGKLEPAATLVLRKALQHQGDGIHLVDPHLSEVQLVGIFLQTVVTHAGQQYCLLLLFSFNPLQINLFVMAFEIGLELHDFSPVLFISVGIFGVLAIEIVEGAEGQESNPDDSSLFVIHQLQLRSSHTQTLSPL